jgi:hypothetical protein
MGGSAPLPAQQQISNALAMALRQSGGGGGGGNPLAGGGGGNGPPGGRGGGGLVPQNTPQIPIVISKIQQNLLHFPSLATISTYFLLIGYRNKL